jgi:hypothetical protein
MMTPERPKFLEFLGSPAASNDAQNASKNSIFFGFGTAIFVVFARPWDFGFWWLLIFPALAFALSILAALPVWLARMSAAWLSWTSPPVARGLTFAIDIAGLAAYVASTYYGLRAVWLWTN